MKTNVLIIDRKLILTVLSCVVDTENKDPAHIQRTNIIFYFYFSL